MEREHPFIVSEAIGDADWDTFLGELIQKVSPRKQKLLRQAFPEGESREASWSAIGYAKEVARPFSCCCSEAKRSIRVTSTAGLLLIVLLTFCISSWERLCSFSIAVDPVMGTIPLTQNTIPPQTETATVTDEIHGPCKSGHVYVYTLPEVFNYAIVKACDTPDCPHYAHMGLGEPAFQHKNGKVRMKELKRVFVDPTCWFKPKIWAIALTYHARLLQHPCRTTDPEKAAAFFLPLYIGLALRKVISKNNETLSNKLPDAFVAWLVKQPYFTRNGGHDHFIVLGSNSSPYMSKDGDKWGCHLLKRPAMENVTKLSSVRSSWEDTQMGIPYATFFHPSTDAQLESWQHHVHAWPRRWRVSFVGSMKRKDGPYDFSKASFRLRQDLAQLCKDWDRCSILDCADSGMGEKSICHEPGPPLEMQLSSDFCLQPAGDDPPRKSTFDAMVAGCIPVFFQKEAAYFQYLWHLPADRERYSVFIDEAEIQSGNVTLRQVLGEYSEERILAMRKLIIDHIMPRVIIGSPETYALVETKDAVDIALEGVLTKVARMRYGLKHNFPTAYEIDNLTPTNAFSTLQPPSNPVRE